MIKKWIIRTLLAALAIVLVVGLIVEKGRIERVALRVLGSIGLEKSASASNLAKLPIRNKPSAKPTPNKIYYRDKVIVLMYHEVTPTQVDAGTVKTSTFEKQLKLMKENGFRWINMKQYRDFILYHTPVPNNAVLLTFDDGYESFYKNAYPVLKQFKAPATSFLIVNTVNNPKHIGIPKVTWEQVSEMQKGGITFFNHTFDSHSYAYTDAAHKRQKALLYGPIYVDKLKRKETSSEFQARIRSDLSRANQLLNQKTGNTYNVLAFPYGAFSKRTLSVCRELGIDITFTVKRGINTYGQMNGYRVNAGGTANSPEVLIEYMKEGAPGKKTLTDRYNLLQVKPLLFNDSEKGVSIGIRTTAKKTNE